jgi:hypothetical protein
MCRTDFIMHVTDFIPHGTGFIPCENEFHYAYYGFHPVR